MKSIKYKILLSFGVTTAFIIISIGFLISSKLSANIEKQSEMLTGKLSAMTDESLVGYHGVFESTVNSIMEDVESIAAEASSRSDIVIAVEKGSPETINAIMSGYRNRTDKIDFVVLFDLDGNYVASYPTDIEKDINIFGLEKFYHSSKLWEKVQNTQESGSGLEKHKLQDVTKFDAGFIEAIQLTDKNFTGNDFLGMQSAKMIHDDFGDPLAVVITGKILNGYAKPLEEFYNTTGLACAIYLGISPIAHTGFRDKGVEASNDLRISPEVIEKVYAANKPKNVVLTLAGNKYRTTCSTITNSGGEKLGIICVGMTEQRIIEIEQAARSHGIESKRELQIWLFGIGLTSVAVFVIVAFFIATGVVGPVSKVVQLANAIARGDLTQRLDMKRQDELGIMATALDDSCMNLTTMIKEIKTNSDTLAISAEEMSTVSTQMASSSEEMTLQSNSVAGATEEVSTGINAMASAAEEMSVNIQSVSSATEEMSQAMKEIAASISDISAEIKDVAENAQKGSTISRQAKEKSDSAKDTMSVLGKAAKEIGEVTYMIKRVAGQTDLLALNATIEAASAGEAGKGFAVVASEIKELANQSGQAAEDIAKRIEGIQSNTEEAVEIIIDVADLNNKISESSVKISRSVELQTTAASEIVASVQQASTGVGNMASSMAEIARGATDVARTAAEIANSVTEVSSNIQGVNQAANDSNAGAQQVDSLADELTKMASQIQQMVSMFKMKEA